MKARLTRVSGKPKAKIIEVNTIEDIINLIPKNNDPFWTYAITISKNYNPDEEDDIPITLEIYDDYKE